jgi:hypothetical protein
MNPYEPTETETASRKPDLLPWIIAFFLGVMVVSDAITIYRLKKENDFYIRFVDIVVDPLLEEARNK